MPYEAWLMIAPVMKQARISGLFNGWVPGNKKKVSNDNRSREVEAQNVS
jgi:hypothetical protein